MGLTGNLTLDAQGDPNAVFIFQVASTLITATDSSVRLVNGAQACNVFWQVGSSATLGTRTAFKGNVLALTSISVKDGATWRQAPGSQRRGDADQRHRDAIGVRGRQARLGARAAQTRICTRREKVWTSGSRSPP